MATNPRDRKFKDRLIVDAPSVNEYRARIHALEAAGVFCYRTMLERLGVKGQALERAVSEQLSYDDALALAQATGDLDVSAVWGEVPVS